MIPTRRTNSITTLLQPPLGPNKGTPSKVHAPVGFRVSPLSYDWFYSDILSGYRCKCIGYAIRWRYRRHRWVKCSRISKSTQKTPPPRKQTPQARRVMVLPSCNESTAHHRYLAAMVRSGLRFSPRRSLLNKECRAEPGSLRVVVSSRQAGFGHSLTSNRTGMAQEDKGGTRPNKSLLWSSFAFDPED
jgi:hypothetical protein